MRAHRVAVTCVAAICVLAGGVPAAVPVLARSSPAAGVPAGFHATAMSWISARRGWVLGAKACGRASCATSQVIATADGGASWHLTGTVHAPVPRLGLGTTGVTEIRFATQKVGWAFAPGLVHTTDGGRTWTAAPIPGHGKQVLDLAVTPAAAYAIVSPCAYDHGLCGSQEPLSVWRTGESRVAWTRLPVRPHINTTARVAARGPVVYVVDPTLTGAPGGQLYVSADGGRRFAARRVPCTQAEIYALVQVIPYGAGRVALLCDGNAGFSQAVKAVYRSADRARTFSYAGTMGAYGIQSELAVSPNGNLAVASWSDGSFIYVNDSRGTSWHMVIGSGDGGAGFNDITYVSRSTAWVIYSPADMFPGIGVLYVTRDAGRHWMLVRF